MELMPCRDNWHMRDVHYFHVKVLCDTQWTPDLSCKIMNLTEAGAVTTRTLTIVLPESEWQALRTAEPDAIGWLQAQIRQRLGDERAPKRDDESAFDEY
jgi:hypothetical protein